MMSSGLGWTHRQQGDPGGFAKEFFDRIQALEGSTAYHTPSATYGRGAFWAMIHSTQVDVRYGEHLATAAGPS